MTLTYFQGFCCKLRIVFPQTMLYFCHILNHQPLWGRYLVVQRVFKWDLNWQSFDCYHIYCSMIWNDSIFQKFHLFPIVKAMILVISIKKKALWRPKILFNIIIHFWSSKTSSSYIIKWHNFYVIMSLGNGLSFPVHFLLHKCFQFMLDQGKNNKL